MLFIFRKKPPSDVIEFPAANATILKEVDALFVTLLVLVLNIFSPVILLAGLSPSLFNRLLHMA